EALHGTSHGRGLFADLSRADRPSASAAKSGLSTLLAHEPSSDEPQVSPFYIPATDPDATRDRRVLKYADCFVVLDESGSIQAAGMAAEGLFFQDTRHLSQLMITIEGKRPLLLS